MHIYIYKEAHEEFCEQFMMDSKSAKAFLFVVVALALHSNVFGAQSIAEQVNRSTSGVHFDNGNSEISGRRLFSQLGYFSMSSDDLEASRISGGMYATKGQFPFMAVVHRILSRGTVSQCGGTILSSRWVLTAGHCIANMPRRFFVVFGIVDKSGIAFNVLRGRGVSMMTNQGALHPQYSITANDIGLLYMPRDIPFSTHIRPIRLPNINHVSMDFADKIATVIGWGRDKFTTIGTTSLKYATLPIISNENCSSYWSVTKKHICTAANYGQDACQGDSGGPLIVMEKGEPIQVGIVSYGDRNCPSSKPGVFTRMTEYLDWIEQTTQILY